MSDRLGLCDVGNFVAHSHSLHDRCVRFRPAVASRSCNTRYRGGLLGLARVGLSPTGPRQLSWRTRRLLDPPYHSVRRVFPSTAGRRAFQTAPSQSVVGLSLLPAYTNQHLVCFRPSCISGSLRFSRTVPGRGLDHAPPSWVGYPPPKGPSLGSRLFCPGPSSLNRPHPPHSQAHHDFTAWRLIRAVFAVRERLGDPRVVPGFRCSFRPDMPSSLTPGSSTPTCPEFLMPTLAFAEMRPARHSQLSRNPLRAG